VRIDASHRNWALLCGLILVGATVAYVLHDWATPGYPSGKSWLGLTFGVLGTLMMLLAGLLGVRRRVLLLRVGSLSWWMKGHLWLGLLSLPVILLHGAFSFGGALTTVMMLLLILVVASGIYGAILQHTMPKLITAEVPDESTYEALERARLELRVEAFTLVATTCGYPAAEEEKLEARGMAGRDVREGKLSIKVDPKADDAVKEKAAADAALVERSHRDLRKFYESYVVPYLRRPRRRAALADEVRAAILFDRERPRLHSLLHETLDELERVCREMRQKSRQVRLHRLLHDWLLVHIPLSTALLALTPVHIVAALYY
jgi:hypothetical protein